MNRKIPARVRKSDGDITVLAASYECPKPDAAVYTDDKHCCCAKGDETCPFFVSVGKVKGKRYVDCSGFGPDAQVMVRDLDVKVKELLSSLCRERSVLGRWVREQLRAIPINNVISRQATPEEEEEPRHEPELKLLEVMVVPERVWRIATAAHLLERLGRRSMYDPVDPDTILPMYLAISQDEK